MRFLVDIYTSTKHPTRKSFTVKLAERYCKFLFIYFEHLHVFGMERDNKDLFFSGMQIKALHMYDCLRANKSTSAWGLEARVPFLDKDFINVAMSIDPEFKMVRIKGKK